MPLLWQISSVTWAPELSSENLGRKEGSHCPGWPRVVISSSSSVLIKFSHAYHRRHTQPLHVSAQMDSKHGQDSPFKCAWEIENQSQGLMCARYTLLSSISSPSFSFLLFFKKIIFWNYYYIIPSLSFPFSNSSHSPPLALSQIHNIFLIATHTHTQTHAHS